MTPVTWLNVARQHSHLQLLAIKTGSQPHFSQDTTCHENSLDQTVVMTALEGWKQVSEDNTFYHVPHQDSAKALEAIITLAEISEDSFIKSYALSVITDFFDDAVKSKADIIVVAQD